MARRVSVDGTEIGPAYVAELAVGAVPSVV
jgi:hypothetical protein